MNRKLKALALATAVAVPTAGLTNAEAHHGKVRDANKIKVTGGDTKLALNDAAKTGLSSQGITLTAIAPATLADGTLTFPIAGGKLKTTGTTGFLAHKGGVTFTKGDRSLKLRGVTLGTNGHGAGAVWALVGHRARFAFKHGGHKLAHASHHGRRGARHVRWHWRWHVARVLALTNVKRTDETGKSTITADAALTKQGAMLLDRKLNTTAFSAGDAVGTVTSTATTG